MRNHISDFIAGLSANSQINWDWRIDFLAHSAESNSFHLESLNYDTNPFVEAMYQDQGGGRFFTNNVDEFRKRLSKVRLLGDEAPLIALDCCLDFPWRESVGCHRVIVMMTDEPFETGTSQPEQTAMLGPLIEKIQGLRVMLYLVAPDSPMFSQLSAVEKSVYEVVDRTGDGMASVDFHEIMLEIGKSVSVVDPQMSKPKPVQRGLFNQATWTPGGSISAHDRS